MIISKLQELLSLRMLTPTNGVRVKDHLSIVVLQCTKQIHKNIQSRLEADLAELVIAARASKGVQVCCALIQLQNSSAHSLHEDSVVSDKNECGVAACQPFLHPFDSLQPLMALLRRQKLCRVRLGQGDVHKCMDDRPG